MIKTFEKEGRSISCQITYKKRKTLGIYIDVYGNIELRVPKATRDQAIDKLIDSKWKWIITRSDEMKERTKGFKEKVYEDGETFLYLGQHFPIRLKVDPAIKKAKVKFESLPSGSKSDDEIRMETRGEDNRGILIEAPCDEEDVLKKAMTRFYKQQCKKIVESRIRHYQPQFKMKPKSITISSNKKNWGSCSSLRELTFNWKLAMAPMEVVDYVVVHEMCHMVHMNHDRSFWRLVGKFIPDYETRQEWLRDSHWKMVV